MLFTDEPIHVKLYMGVAARQLDRSVFGIIQFING